MRSRSVREGSVGLLIILGVGLFGATAFWLRGISLGQQSYQIRAEFPSATGLQIGVPVRYRAVRVGRVTRIQPQSNGVEVLLNIESTDLVMPRNSQVLVNQTGFLNETYIDIIPNIVLTPELVAANPIAADCPSSDILCHESSVQGLPGISPDRLMETMLDLGELYGNPELFANLNAAVENTALAAAEATQLTTKMGQLVDIAKLELGNFSASVDQNMNLFSSEMTQLSEQLERSMQEVSGAALQSANSLDQVTGDISALTQEVNALVATNRSTLLTTLNNINETSQELSVAIATLTPVIARFEQGELLTNLETLSANAVIASENLRDVSQSVNNPDNIILLQQTLDSARSTLQNMQKVTADIEDLTGDPRLRDSLRRIINGLGNILASTQELERQTAVAETLAPLSQAADAGDEKTMKLLFSEIDSDISDLWALVSSPDTAANSPRWTIDSTSSVEIYGE
ncbi:Mammalian cell entry related domain protein [Limnospira maxima CS-328]|uniref:Mammalian cell entry related domain protein n=1 Tax=Limnospira maxima CS-328 TaxID=513049 RepID=B5W0F8_LIMMA|nr:MlaD family protein [Limnospira maxima]EDZ95074.1 Mammalian cell entry related domain protein [Limnospira maxima CS-328]MDC0839024.1 MlaD family protein [Limnoraphis robusta]